MVVVFMGFVEYNCVQTGKKRLWSRNTRTMYI